VSSARASIFGSGALVVSVVVAKRSVREPDLGHDGMSIDEVRRNVALGVDSTCPSRWSRAS